VTYKVVSGMRCAPAFAHASRRASISAWALGSCNSRVAFPALAIILPLLSVMTAPIGTSSREAAAIASSIAMRIRLWSWSVNELGLVMEQEKHKGDRIAKVMARAGICSRRDAEKWIAERRVKVNGKVITSPALNIVASDKVIVDGKLLPREEQTRLFLYHKPPGLVTTHKDEQGRSTVFDELPKSLPRVVSVGRLDLNTEGLLLLTNDGGLSRHLELPDTGWKRKYRVRVNGKVNPTRLASLKSGITVEGVRYKSIEAKLEEQPEGRENAGANSWISITLREGKNREIRRVMEALGLRVTRLIRTDYGPFTLGKMERGAVSEVSVGVMRSQISRYFEENNINLKREIDPKDKNRTFGRSDKNRSEKNSQNTKNPKKFSSKTQEKRKNPTNNAGKYKKSDK